MQVVMHYDPVWKDRVDTLVTVYLGCYNLPDSLELMWCIKRNDNEYQIGCIPFFSRGLALGDVIQTTKNGEFAFVLSKSTHQIFRVAILDQHIGSTIRTDISEHVASLGLSMEWHNNAYCAIDIIHQQDVESLIRLLQPHHNTSVYFEFDG
jgi:hypothetical protein